MIAEHDGATGAALREYVYLGLILVAYVDHSGASPVTYYVHTDQVMRPRKLTDAAGAVLWDRIATPFGDEHTVTGTLTQKLQFPGQIEDSETAFFQNWHRDYDPELGRYVQSDPIGLLGGINTYGYVGGNPVMYVDPSGLEYKEFGQVGHGGIIGPVDNNVIYVADIPEKDAIGDKTVICGCGTPPENADVDFFYQPGIGTTKIVNGFVKLYSSQTSGRSVPPISASFSPIYSGPRSYRNAGGSGGVPAVTLRPGFGAWTGYGLAQKQRPPHQ